MEHAYRTMKAEMLNRRELLQQIMSQTSKQVQSVLSRMTCNEWERVKVSVMARLLLSKFENCTEFREKIHALNGLRVHIVEATRNNFWGIGCTHSELRRTHSSYWPGHNVMGQLLNMLVNDSNNPTDVVADYMDLYVNSNFLPHARQTSNNISAGRRDISPAPSDHSLCMGADEKDQRGMTEPVIQTRSEPAKVPAPQVVTQKRSVPLNMSIALIQNLSLVQKSSANQYCSPKCTQERVRLTLTSSISN